MFRLVKVWKVYKKKERKKRSLRTIVKYWKIKIKRLVAEEMGEGGVTFPHIFFGKNLEKVDFQHGSQKILTQRKVKRVCLKA